MSSARAPSASSSAMALASLKVMQSAHSEMTFAAAFLFLSLFTGPMPQPYISTLQPILLASLIIYR